MVNKISIIIPTYNRINKTIEAINSVSTKNFESTEIIVVDDASKNPFPKLSNIKLINLSENAGPGVARSMGVAKSSFNLISFLDSDDLYTKEWISTLQQLDVADNTLIVGSTVNGKKWQQDLFNLLLKFPSKIQLFFCKIIINFFNPFYTPSICMTKNIAFFHNTLRYCEDYYTNAMAIFYAKRIVLINKDACILNRIPGTEGGESVNKKKMLIGEIEVKKNILFCKRIPIQYKLFTLLGFLYTYLRFFLRK